MKYKCFFLRGQEMIQYLTHYYRFGSKPFMTLSAISDDESLKIMNKLYMDNEIWGRFKKPEVYLSERKKCEKWLKEEFIKKGGTPKQEYPIYTVLGVSEKIEKHMIKDKIGKVQIPLSIFEKNEVSFTFIDSMYSKFLVENKTHEHYIADYHGKVFTYDEISKIIDEKGELKKGWWGKLPDDFFPYIEAQVWNGEKLKNYITK